MDMEIIIIARAQGRACFCMSMDVCLMQSHTHLHAAAAAKSCAHAVAARNFVAAPARPNLSAGKKCHIVLLNILQNLLRKH